MESIYVPIIGRNFIMDMGQESYNKMADTVNGIGGCRKNG